MIIKRFENIKEEYTEHGYTQSIDDEIKKFNADVPFIKYYIARAADKLPYQRMSTTSLDRALNEMMLLNNASNIKDYCVFEGRYKALTKEDIDVYFNSQKYNL